MEQKKTVTPAVVVQLENANSEIDIYSQEVQRFIIRSAYTIMDRETTALSHAFSLSAKEIEFYISPL